MGIFKSLFKNNKNANEVAPSTQRVYTEKVDAVPLYLAIKVAVTIKFFCICPIESIRQLFEQMNISFHRPCPWLLPKL